MENGGLPKNTGRDSNQFQEELGRERGRKRGDTQTADSSWSGYFLSFPFRESRQYSYNIIICPFCLCLVKVSVFYVDERGKNISANRLANRLLEPFQGLKRKFISTPDPGNV